MPRPRVPLLQQTLSISLQLSSVPREARIGSYMQARCVSEPPRERSAPPRATVGSVHLSPTNEALSFTLELLEVPREGTGSTLLFLQALAATERVGISGALETLPGEIARQGPRCGDQSR